MSITSHTGFREYLLLTLHSTFSHIISSIDFVYTEIIWPNQGETANTSTKYLKKIYMQDFFHCTAKMLVITSTLKADLACDVIIYTGVPTIWVFLWAVCFSGDEMCRWEMY